MRKDAVKWKPPQPHYIESACENYRVSKAQVKGEIRYLAWINTRKKDSYGNDIWEQIGEYSTNFKDAVSRFKEGR
jgi:hypothetical protein